MSYHRIFFRLAFVLLIPIAGFCGPIDLSRYESAVYSQNGEDGILEKIFNLLNINTGYCVEFGAADGVMLSNSMQLRKKGWEALLMDACYENEEINLFKEWITRENILSLFDKYEVPEYFELLSIDIDSNDWYIWKEIGKHYHPKVVVIEYNPSFGPNEDRVIEYNPERQWTGDCHFGASFMAYYRLGRSLGYSLVASTCSNAIFIRDDLLLNKKLNFKYKNNPKKLFQGPSRICEEADQLPYRSSSQLLMD